MTIQVFATFIYEYNNISFVAKLTTDETFYSRYTYWLNLQTNIRPLSQKKP